MEELSNTTSIFIGTVLGGIISFLSSWLLEKQRLKKEILLLNRNKVDEAYKNIFNSLILLKKYYSLFIQPGNEFKESEDYKKFSPLRKITIFYNCIEENSIYIDDKLYDEINRFLSKIMNHNQIAMAICISPDDFTEKDIEEMALQTIREIDQVIKFIKKRFIA